MAVIKMPKSCVLSILVQTGITTTGAPAYKYRNYGNVKPAAADADLFAIGQELAALQRHSVVAITRQDNSSLIDQ